MLALIKSLSPLGTRIKGGSLSLRRPKPNSEFDQDQSEKDKDKDNDYGKDSIKHLP